MEDRKRTYTQDKDERKIFFSEEKNSKARLGGMLYRIILECFLPPGGDLFWGRGPWTDLRGPKLRGTWEETCAGLQWMKRPPSSNN